MQVLGKETVLGSVVLGVLGVLAGGGTGSVLGRAIGESVGEITGGTVFGGVSGAAGGAAGAAIIIAIMWYRGTSVRAVSIIIK